MFCVHYKCKYREHWYEHVTMYGTMNLAVNVAERIKRARNTEVKVVDTETEKVVWQAKP